MIPKRIHRNLPDDSQWVITDHPGQLTVYLAADVPADSPLEQHFVRQATRAWRRRNYPGLLVILPIVAMGVAWAARKVRQPLAATGVVAGSSMIALATVTVTGPDELPPRPAVVGAPPVHSPTVPPRAGNPTPSRPPTTPPPTRSPSPPAVNPTPQPGKPGKPHPTTGRGNSSGKPGHTPPGHGGTPPGKPPSKPPPVTPPDSGGAAIESACQLVKIRVGHLVRICL